MLLLTAFLPLMANTVSPCVLPHARGQKDVYESIMVQHWDAIGRTHVWNVLTAEGKNKGFATISGWALFPVHQTEVSSVEDDLYKLTPRGSFHIRVGSKQPAVPSYVLARPDALVLSGTVGRPDQAVLAPWLKPLLQSLVSKGELDKGDGLLAVLWTPLKYMGGRSRYRNALEAEIYLEGKAIIAQWDLESGLLGFRRLP